jgi:hypothetical protein
MRRHAQAPPRRTTPPPPPRSPAGAQGSSGGGPQPGVINLSARSLKQVPEAVFGAAGPDVKWWEVAEVTKVLLRDNQLTALPAQLWQQPALAVLDVRQAPSPRCAVGAAPPRPGCNAMAAAPAPTTPQTRGSSPRPHTTTHAWRAPPPHI